jgi:hypothetical protein
LYTPRPVHALSADDDDEDDASAAEVWHSTQTSMPGLKTVVQPLVDFDLKHGLRVEVIS